MLMHCVNLVDVTVESEQAVVVKWWDGPLVYARIPSSQELNGSSRKASCRTLEDTTLFWHPSSSSHNSISFCTLVCRKDCASGAGWEAVPVSQNQVANRGSWGLEKAAQAPGIFVEKALV